MIGLFHFVGHGQQAGLQRNAASGQTARPVQRLGVFDEGGAQWACLVFRQMRLGQLGVQVGNLFDQLIVVGAVFPPSQRGGYGAHAQIVYRQGIHFLHICGGECCLLVAGDEVQGLHPLPHMLVVGQGGGLAAFTQLGNEDLAPILQFLAGLFAVCPLAKRGQARDEQRAQDFSTQGQ